jgi:t-SNARE complex subunit (syntaxin)
MNKKEIAQQFNRQMLGQESSSLSGPDNQQEHPSELEQIRALLVETEKLYSRAQENYRYRSEKRIDDTSRRLDLLDSKATNLAFQIKSIVYSAEQIYKANNQTGSRWVIRLYLIAILSGICSALITMLVIWIKVH